MRTIIKETMYECEFCHEIMHDKDAMIRHESECDCRPENFPILKKRYEDKWFVVVVKNEGYEDVYHYYHVLSMNADEFSEVTYRVITIDPCYEDIFGDQVRNEFFRTYISKEDLNEFIYETLMDAHEVSVEDVEEHVKDVIDGVFA